MTVTPAAPRGLPDAACIGGKLGNVRSDAPAGEAGPRHKRSSVRPGAGRYRESGTSVPGGSAGGGRFTRLQSTLGATRGGTAACTAKDLEVDTRRIDSERDSKLDQLPRSFCTRAGIAAETKAAVNAQIGSLRMTPGRRETTEPITPVTKRAR